MNSFYLSTALCFTLPFNRFTVAYCLRNGRRCRSFESWHWNELRLWKTIIRGLSLVDRLRGTHYRSLQATKYWLIAFYCMIYPCDVCKIDFLKERKKEINTKTTVRKQYHFTAPFTQVGQSCATQLTQEQNNKVLWRRFTKMRLDTLSFAVSVFVEFHKTPEDNEKILRNVGHFFSANIAKCAVEHFSQIKN